MQGHCDIEDGEQAHTDRATLLRLLDAAREENFALAAGACIVAGGLVGDEGGSPVCTLRAALQEIAGSPSHGAGCNPEGFVSIARAALKGT